jgi:hypothetical protein
MKDGVDGLPGSDTLVWSQVMELSRSEARFWLEGLTDWLSVPTENILPSLSNHDLSWSYFVSETSKASSHNANVWVPSPIDHLLLLLVVVVVVVVVAVVEQLW